MLPFLPIPVCFIVFPGYDGVLFPNIYDSSCGSSSVIKYKHLLEAVTKFQATVLCTVCFISVRCFISFNFLVCFSSVELLPVHMPLKIIPEDETDRSLLFNLCHGESQLCFASCITAHITGCCVLISVIPFEMWKLTFKIMIYSKWCSVFSCLPFCIFA